MHSVKAWKHPDNYLGATWYGWHSAGFGQTRDSDSLERSNFHIASEQLLALAGEVIDGLAETESVQVIRENHWACGWVEWIAIHDSNTAALALARQLCDKANDYPVLNESHWSELEYSEAMEFWDSLSLADKVDMCRENRASIFAARRASNLPEAVYERLCHV